MVKCEKCENRGQASQPSSSVSQTSTRAAPCRIKKDTAGRRRERRPGFSGKSSSGVSRSEDVMDVGCETGKRLVARC